MSSEEDNENIFFVDSASLTAEQIISSTDDNYLNDQENQANKIITGELDFSQADGEGIVNNNSDNQLETIASTTDNYEPPIISSASEGPQNLHPDENESNLSAQNQEMQEEESKEVLVLEIPPKPDNTNSNELHNAKQVEENAQKSGKWRKYYLSLSKYLLGQFIVLFVCFGIFFLICLFVDIRNEKQEKTPTFVLATIFLMGSLWFSNQFPNGVVAFLPVVIYPFFGVMKEAEVAHLYINNTSMLFIGGFFLALSMERWGIHKKISTFIVFRILTFNFRNAYNFLKAIVSFLLKFLRIRRRRRNSPNISKENEKFFKNPRKIEEKQTKSEVNEEKNELTIELDEKHEEINENLIENPQNIPNSNQNAAEIIEKPAVEFEKLLQSFKEDRYRITIFDVLDKFSFLFFTLTLMAFQISWFLSDTATTLVMMPSAKAVIGSFEDIVLRAAGRKHSVAAKKLMNNLYMCTILGISYSSLIGGIGTLVGTPANMVFSRQFEKLFPTREPISFFKYCVFAIPLAFTTELFMLGFIFITLVVPTTIRLKRLLKKAHDEDDYEPTLEDPLTPLSPYIENLPNFEKHEQKSPSQSVEIEDIMQHQKTIIGRMKDGILQAGDKIYSIFSKKPFQKPKKLQELQKQKENTLKTLKKNKKVIYVDFSHVESELSKGGFFRIEEIFIMLLFVALVASWMLRNDIGYIPGWSRLFKANYVGDGTVAILFSIILFFVPIVTGPPEVLEKIEKSKALETKINKILEKQKLKLSNFKENSKDVEKFKIILESMAKNFANQVEDLKNFKLKDSNSVQNSDEDFKFVGDKILNWDKNIQSQFAWQIIFVFGGGFALADGFDSSGLTKIIASQISEFQKILSTTLHPLVTHIILCFTCGGLSSLVTEFSSSISVVQMFLPIVISIGQGLYPKDEPFPEDVRFFQKPFILNRLTVSCTLMVVVTVCASLGFISPFGTPSNMIAFSFRDSKTGKRYVEMWHMMVLGVFVKICVVLAVLYCALLAPALLC